MDFIFDPNLALYLPLYELDGASFMSKDKHGHLCTVTGALWTPHGRSFDGVDDLIVTSANIGISGVAARSLEVWVNFNAASLVVNKIANVAAWGWTNNGDTDPANGGGFCISSYGYAGAGKWAMWGAGGGSWDVVSNSALTAETWYHLVATYDGVTARLFKNGDADGSQVNTLNTANTPVYIGRKLGLAGDRLWLKGSIGEVRIYNRALSPLEIQHNYLANKWRYR